MLDLYKIKNERIIDEINPLKNHILKIKNYKKNIPLKMRSNFFMKI